MTTHFLRERFGLSQQGLADLFDIPYNTVKSWDKNDCLKEYEYKILELALERVEEFKKKD